MWSHRAARVLLGTLAVAGLLVWPTAPAGAHGSAIASWPAVGQTLDGAPRRVIIEFDTEISTSSAGVLVAVVDAEGSPVTSGDPAVEGVYVAQAIEPTAAAGVWTVSYHVISADRHDIIGRVDFVVDPGAEATVNPAGEPPDVLDARPEPPTTCVVDCGGSQGGQGPFLLLVGVGLVVVLIVVMRVAAARKGPS